MRDTRPDYPPEFDEECPCALCGVEAGSCECPECPQCDVQGDPRCYAQGHLPKNGRAFNLQDLADHLGASQGTEASISKRLFKDTECGISFWVQPGGTVVIGYGATDPAIGVGISGYAEGSGDATCEPILFNFPIDLAEFDKAVEKADQDGCDLYEEFHCSQCGAETGYEEPCEECD